MSGNAPDIKQIGPLILGIIVLCTITLIADVVILIRWLIYQRQIERLESTLTFATFASAPAALPDFDIRTLVEVPAVAEQSIETAREDRYSTDADSDEQSASFATTTPAEPLPAETNADSVSLPYVPPLSPQPAATIKAPFAPTWSLIDPFLGFQAMLALLLVGIIPLMLLAFAFGGGARALIDPTSVAQQFVMVSGLYLQEAATVGVVAFYLWRYGLRLTDIGLRRPTLRQIGLGLVLGVVLLLLANTIEMTVVHLMPHSVADSLKKMGEGFEAGTMFKTLASPTLKVLFILGGAVAAPIAEEVFFRGFLYNALKRRWNVGAAIVVSGFAFAIIHFSPLSMLAIFPMGMVLAYVYERTQSLWVTIIMHAVNNGTAFLILWFFPKLGG